jgi:DNA-3-methyladenine glycosylase
MNSGILKKDFYTQADTVMIARTLLGKTLHTQFSRKHTAGVICETEAYCGTTDRGCHAYNGRLTDRTRIMYAEGGVSYVYLCYGIHHLFNVVTHTEGEPHAVLIRAIAPLEGIETMVKRRGISSVSDQLAAGPGLVAQCLGLTTKHNGLSLLGDQIWITNAPVVDDGNILASPRVGMNFSGPYHSIPWRFRIKGSPHTSKAR